MIDAFELLKHWFSRNGINPKDLHVEIRFPDDEARARVGTALTRELNAGLPHPPLNAVEPYDGTLHELPFALTVDDQSAATHKGVESLRNSNKSAGSLTMAISTPVGEV